MKFTFGPESRPLDGFTIKRAIARGGFGEVYYALTDSGKEVAIKLLQDNLEVELRGVSQCLNLKHPNLVTIFDIKQDRENDHWIVMEYVGGKTLDRVIHEHPNGLPLDEVLAWLEGIAAGIGFLHDRGLVHRDLKPANIFRENGVVKVGDVGLSKFIAPSRRSAHTQSVGTVYYMAPEVAKGRYGREVDVYSLAIILFEMLTGKVPFDGETTAEILMKHLTERPDLNALPVPFRSVIERALEKDPQRRTHDVLQLAQQFRDAARGGGVAVEPPPIPVAAASVDRVSSDSPVASSELEKTQAYGRERPVSASFFPAPKRPESRFEVLCRASGRAVGSAWTLWRAHPLLIMATVVAVLLWTSPAYGARAVPLLSSSRTMLWMLFATIMTVEVFRGVSRAVDWIFLPVRASDARRSVQSGYGVRLNPPAGGKKMSVRVVDPNTVRDISWQRRSIEMTGSLATASFATALVTGVLLFVTKYLEKPAHAGLFAAGTLLGAGCLLIVGKLREGMPRERYVDRILLGCVGVVVGLALFQLNGWLLCEIPADGWMPTPNLLATVGASSNPSTPRILLESYVGFFATLFGFRRWWWHTDSFRPQRFRVLSVMATAFVGAIAAELWGFPVLWGTVWAASLSSVVQLSAAWTPWEFRR